MTRLTYLLLAAWISVAPGAHATQAPDPRDAIIAAREAGTALDAEGVKRLAAMGARLLDVRSAEEWKAGHIEGAQHAYWLNVMEPVTQLWPDKSTPIVTYCAVGARSRAAAMRLRAAGYTHVIAMTQGGYAELVQAGLPKAP
ncbi:rhodanese-like domain-containing protein [Fontimonas sp. SYSU GA230001]|uniref:rhodanese-like domain-containing protein n=1 Tax=Fontimonas sp. SYSU GA230001 TaxID=3142450 RepID=UPI0032B37AD2